MSISLKIEVDQDPENPREWDNIGIMVCLHRRHRLGDVRNMSLEDALALEKKMVKEGICLPLYLYDHSGITMATTPFSCPWDSGKVGFIYVNKEKAKEEFGRYWKKKALKSLEAEVLTYDQYISGDVYGYVIEDEDGNHLDSCYGFYGREEAEKEGTASLEYFKKAA